MPNLKAIFNAIDNLTMPEQAVLVASALGAASLAAPEEAEAMYVGPSATGWAKLGNKFTNLMDRKVRAEISDAGASIPANIRRKWANNQLFPEDNYALAEVYQHPELYKQYPELRDALVSFRKGVGGETMEPEPGMFHISLGTGAKSNQEMLEVLTHEAQHPIQSIEGWARGGDPQSIGISPQIWDKKIGDLDALIKEKSLADTGELGKLTNKWLYGDGLKLPEFQRMEDLQKKNPEISGLLSKIENTRKEFFSSGNPYEKYKSLSGEIEARDTAARMGLSAAERARQLPYSGQGIPLKDTITKMGVAAPVGAVLAEQLAERRAFERSYDGAGLGDAYGPGDFAADVAATAATGGAYLPAKAALAMGTKAGLSGLALDLMMNHGIGPTLKNALIGGGYISPLSADMGNPSLDAALRYFMGER